MVSLHLKKNVSFYFFSYCFPSLFKPWAPASNSAPLHRALTISCCYILKLCWRILAALLFRGGSSMRFRAVYSCTCRDARRQNQSSDSRGFPLSSRLGNAKETAIVTTIQFKWTCAGASWQWCTLKTRSFENHGLNDLDLLGSHTDLHHHLWLNPCL